MGLNDILLVCAALIPAVALCIYIFKKDRVEKEPIGLLLGLLFLGGLICFPAAEIEGVLFDIFDMIFSRVLEELLFNNVIDPEVIFVDGTHIKANANKNISMAVADQNYFSIQYQQKYSFVH